MNDNKQGLLIWIWFEVLNPGSRGLLTCVVFTNYTVGGGHGGGGGVGDLLMATYLILETFGTLVCGI